MLAVDGDYGKNTYNAIIKYQRDNGLTVDGKLGDETWNHMWDSVEKKYGGSEQNRYAENEYNISGMTVPEYNASNKQSTTKQNEYGSGMDNFMKGIGATQKYYKVGFGREKSAYSPDGYVEKAESENASRDREDPITGIQNPYDMASYAQNYSDTMEWLYQKNRLSNK